MDTWVWIHWRVPIGGNTPPTKKPRLAAGFFIAAGKRADLGRQLPVQRDLEVHAAHATHAAHVAHVACAGTGSGRLRLIGNDGLGGQEQAGD